MLIFVYGTLKRNFCNNFYLKDEKFVAEVKTKPIYRIYSFNGRFPFLVKDVNGVNIQGELWEVSRKALHYLDVLEGHPNFYRREKIFIEGMEDDIEGYVYYGDVSKLKECSPKWT